MKYIEQGWNSYRENVVPKNAPQIQIDECRQAFFAGASILFTALLMTLDDGEFETEEDMQRMSDIQAEIEEFGNTLDKKYLGQA